VGPAWAEKSEWPTRAEQRATSLLPAEVRRHRSRPPAAACGLDTALVRAVALAVFLLIVPSGPFSRHPSRKPDPAVELWFIDRAVLNAVNRFATFFRPVARVSALSCLEMSGGIRATRAL
jgi:hypothetical protein